MKKKTYSVSLTSGAALVPGALVRMAGFESEAAHTPFATVTSVRSDGEATVEVDTRPRRLRRKDRHKGHNLATKGKQVR